MCSLRAGGLYYSLADLTGQRLRKLTSSLEAAVIRGMFRDSCLEGKSRQRDSQGQGRVLLCRTVLCWPRDFVTHNISAHVCQRKLKKSRKPGDRRPLTGLLQYVHESKTHLRFESWTLSALLPLSILDGDMRSGSHPVLARNRR